LSQPNMRQLKDRIVHHFAMLPLSQNIIETYLLFRMHTAGYRGPTPFASAAAALIGKASQGLMRRVNILADKSLLAAFVEDTHNIEVHHVQAAIRDSELSPPVQALRQRKNIAIAAALVLSATIIIAATGWLFGRMHASNQSETEVKLIKTSASTATHIPSATYAAAPAVNASASVQVTLLDQRLAAAQAMLVKSPAGSASIQLYYTDEVQPLRIEGFLKRADNLGKLHEIYVLPIKINDRKGLRVLYGVYASSEQARSGMRQLPQRYKDAFAPTIYLLEPMPAS
jgi:MSHA biogenesis protein MshM